MILITDKDVRQKIAQVEGEHWLFYDDEQTTPRPKEHTVANARRVYEANSTSVSADDPDADPERVVYGTAIYGCGGWNRYFVLYSGEVVFSAHHGRETIPKAEAAGFKIFR